MTTRRTILGLVAGTAALAGCRSPGDGSGPATDTATDGGTPGGGSGTGLTVEASDVTVAPGSDAVVAIQATDVGGLTWRFGDVPQNWQISYEGFEPQPTAVQESYPPTLLWEPPAASVSGTFVVPVPADAESGAYTLPVEAQAANSDERAVAEATVTVEG